MRSELMFVRVKVCVDYMKREVSCFWVNFQSQNCLCTVTPDWRIRDKMRMYTMTRWEGISWQERIFKDIKRQETISFICVFIPSSVLEIISSVVKTKLAHLFYTTSLHYHMCHLLTGFESMYCLPDEHSKKVVPRSIFKWIWFLTYKTSCTGNLVAALLNLIRLKTNKNKYRPQPGLQPHMKTDMNKQYCKMAFARLTAYLFFPFFVFSKFTQLENNDN